MPVSEDIDLLNTKLEALAAKLDQNDKSQVLIRDSLDIIVKESRIVNRENKESLADAIGLMRRLVAKVDEAVADGDAKYKEQKAYQEQEVAKQKEMKFKPWILYLAPLSLTALAVLKILDLFTH